MTLSTPVKIVALAALAIVLGLGGLVLLTHHSSPSAAVAPPAPAPHLTVKVMPKPKPTLHLEPGLPSIVRSALEQRPVAVVAVYGSQNATDRSVLAAARAGAHQAHAAFVAANVSLEGVALGVSTWAGPSDVPAVLVVRRPGKVVFAVTGLTDSATVAQAATTSR